MTKGAAGVASRQLDTLFRVGTVGGLTDGQLLDRFLDRRDAPAAEVAFTALVERHGPMVLRVCRGVLADAHDAQDAFQATFLILVERAGSIRRRDSLASWLFGVAGRVARRAKVDAARRRAHEHRRAEMRALSSEGTVPDDVGPMLHEEVGRLPEMYRAAVVLCDLEGRSHEAAARQLHWPLGTLKTRLARGRARLRKQMLGRGLAVETLASKTATAAFPAALSRSTVRSALAVANGQARASALSAPVVRLIEGVLGEFVRVRLGTAVLLGALFTLGAARFSRPNLMAASEDPKPAIQAVAPPSKDERAPLELTGRTAYDPDTLTKIRLRFPARIEKVHASLGQKVKKGDPLVDLDSTELAKAKGDMQAKWLQWQRDKRLLEQRTKLRKTGAISDQVWIDAQNDEKKSHLDYRLARDLLDVYKVPPADIDSLIVGLDGKASDPKPLGSLAEKAKMTLLSPADGIVIEREAGPGQLANEKDTLMVLAALDHLWVVASVPEGDRDKVRVGQRCKILVPHRDGSSAGLVEFVSEQPDRDTGRHKIRIRMPNPDDLLKADMTVRVLIEEVPGKKQPLSQFDSRDAPRQ